MRRSTVIATTLAFALIATPALAIDDPEGDFLATYVGPPTPDFDVLSLAATYNDVGVRLTSSFAGAPGNTPGSLYLWGIDRGAGTPALITAGPPSVGPPTVLLDALVRVQANGDAFVLTFSGMGPPVTAALDASLISIAGPTISVFVPFDMLLSTGFAAPDYTYIHWSRSQFGTQDFIADLAPDGGSFTAAAVPEPAAWALMIGGFGMVGGMARRRRGAIAA